MIGKVTFKKSECAPLALSFSEILKTEGVYRFYPGYRRTNQHAFDAYDNSRIIVVRWGKEVNAIFVDSTGRIELASNTWGNEGAIFFPTNEKVSVTIES